MADKQIEKPRQFCRSGHHGLGLLGAGQEVQAILVDRHKSFEQGTIHAMQVLQGVKHAETRAQVQMKCDMPNEGEVHQHHFAVSVL